MAYLIYLRKSRVDREAEARGAGETLSRHRETLLALAARLGLAVGGIYEEIVSGETIAARPEMQRLLAEVGAGAWEGVLVMEVERLARGDSIDQGIVARAFQCSRTRIITPAKTYDPANEFDEEYFEFGLFMSRREYKTIQRRMVAGRAAAVREGRYMGKTDPFGYRRVRAPDGRGFTLTPEPAQAELVREIFARRCAGEGCQAIARQLALRGARTGAGAAWTAQSVRNLLQNPVYAGYVTWGRRPVQPVLRDGALTRPRRYAAEYLRVRGLHPPLVSEADFEAVQRLPAAAPLRRTRALQNPFAGLLFCARCGHALAYNEGRLRCRQAACGAVRVSCAAVEQAALAMLAQWLGGRWIVPAPPQPPIDPAAARRALLARQKQLRAQLDRAAGFAEQGIYSPAYFAARQAALTEALAALDRALAAPPAPPAPPCAPRPLLDTYAAARTAEQKNNLLRALLRRITCRVEDGVLHLTLVRRWG